MSRVTCPHCGHTKTLKAAPIVAPLTRDQLTDAQLYDEYKATAPGLDLRFTMAHAGIRMRDDGAWADEAQALCRQTWPDGRLCDITRPEFYRRLRSLQDEWRRASNIAERAERQVGTDQELGALDTVAEVR